MTVSCTTYVMAMFEKSATFPGLFVMTAGVRLSFRLVQSVPKPSSRTVIVPNVSLLGHWDTSPLLASLG